MLCAGKPNKLWNVEIAIQSANGLTQLFYSMGLLKAPEESLLINYCITCVVLFMLLLLFIFDDYQVFRSVGNLLLWFLYWLS